MRYLVWIVMIFISTMIIADSAYACSCDSLVSAEKKIENAAIIFTGKVKSIQTYNPDSPVIDTRYSNQHIVSIEFEMLEQWKGPEPRKLLLVTNADPVACGESFSIGKTYLVMAGPPEEDRVFITQCTGSGLVSLRGDELAILQGAKP
jgi:hypothetical protein